MSKNEIKLFSNKELGFSARTMLNEDGSISVNAEDTAIGFGWTKTENKNGKEYTSIRWERMNGFSKEFGFAHEWGKDDYIPESLFYRLGMKASNKVADKFQNWLAMEVIPSIRKHGMYAVDELIENPELAIKAFTALKEERERNKALQAENESKQKKITALDKENDLLAERALQWADRPLINALVRAYGRSLGGDYSTAWGDFKKELLYRHGINLNARITHYLNNTGKKTKPRTLDMLDDSELQKALSTAAALCRENNVDISDIIDKKAS